MHRTATTGSLWEWGRFGAPPPPPTSILMVPFGPKFVFMTSRSPFEALMFMNKAARRPITSAFGFSVLTLDMAPDHLHLRGAYGGLLLWREWTLSN